LLAACGREGWSSLVEKRGIKEKENILQVNLSIRNSKKLKKKQLKFFCNISGWEL